MSKIQLVSGFALGIVVGAVGGYGAAPSVPTTTDAATSGAHSVAAPPAAPDKEARCRHWADFARKVVTDREAGISMADEKEAARAALKNTPAAFTVASREISNLFVGDGRQLSPEGAANIYFLDCMSVEDRK